MRDSVAADRSGDTLFIPASKNPARITGPKIGIRYSKLATHLRIAAGKDELIDRNPLRYGREASCPVLNNLCVRALPSLFRTGTVASNWGRKRSG